MGHSGRGPYGSSDGPREFMLPLMHVVPVMVWRKMTPEEYAAQYAGFGRHVAISQEVVEGCQEVWVCLGSVIQFESK